MRFNSIFLGEDLFSILISHWALGNIMNDEWKRKELATLHDNMRTHLYRIIDVLGEEFLTKKISNEENYPDLLSIIRHIGGAETYWFHRAKHDIAPRFMLEASDDIGAKFIENTNGIKHVLQECAVDQLKIISPSMNGGPSVAWCLLRTYQHGLYHTAQIAKIRHMIGASPIEDNPITWDIAVDSITELLSQLWND